MAEKFGRLVDLGRPLFIAEADDEVLGYGYASIYRPRPAYRFTCERRLLTPRRTARASARR